MIEKRWEKYSRRAEINGLDSHRSQSIRRSRMHNADRIDLMTHVLLFILTNSMKLMSSEMG